MAKLYPPLIGGTIPAFYSMGGTTKIVVPFSMNKAVGKSEVYGFALKIKYVDGSIIDTFQIFDSNLSITNASDYNIDENGYYDLDKELSVTFDVNSIKDKYLKQGQYYKIQLAYIGEDLQIGYYSTIGVIKYTYRPTVIIEKLNQNFVNNHQYSYTGVYSQFNRDPTEKVYSSRFILTDSNRTVLEDTGYVLHNTSEDDVPYESREIFTYFRDLKENQTYYLTYKVKTMNGLECSSANYRLTQSRSIGTEIDLQLSAILNYENGYIKLGLICEEPVISGTFLISRACSKDDYSWTEFKRFDVQSLIPSEWSLFDCTIEQGYTYKYSLQQYNANDIYSNRIISNEVYVDFEHAFLYDGNKQFKISYDPKITDFKNNLLENKIDTIGNKYPFILRNGNVNYKSFNIQGLISLRSDEEGLFMDKSSYEWDTFKSDLTSKNITSERLFKMAVLEWLNDGNPKIFRSPTEGNFIVRLLNVSLTPEDRLGRMIHSFKATAYEICPFSIEALEKFGIIDSTEHLSTLTRWTTVDLKEISKENPNRTWVTVNSNRVCYSIKIQDCMPGTIIRIDGKEIMIGATGAYIAESISGFNIVQIKPSDFLGENFSYPIITYSYQTKAVSIFGNITKVQIEDVPLHQIIGTSSHIDIFKSLTNTQKNVAGLDFVRFKKRDIYQVFVNCNKPQDFIPNSNYTYYEDENLLKEININKLSKTAIYQIRCKRNDYRNYYQEGYYIDKNLDNLAPFTDYFLDGNTKSIYPIEDNLFKVILNNEEIDLKEILKYKVQDVNIISSIIINQGVIAEISYSQQISTFYFENNTHMTNLNTYIKQYDNAKIDFQTLLQSKQNQIGIMTDTDKINYLNNLDNATKEIKRKYNLILDELDQAIIEYKEQNGLQ